MTMREYNAKCVRDMLDGNEVVTIEQAILDSLSAAPVLRKREEVCSMVACRTGLSLAETMCSISTVLSKLKKQGKIINPVNGYWMLRTKSKVS